MDEETTAIPVYVVEEHHEAFLLWHYAIGTGALPRAANQLLHVDEHSDLHPAQMDTSLKDLNGDLGRVLELTYDELNIANFIAPALYGGIFDTLYWVRPGEGKDSRDDLAVYSYRSEGRVLFLNRGERLDQGLDRPDARRFRYEQITTASEVADAASVALDVDLDFFLCAAREPARTLLEITRREYEAYRADRYHPLRITPGTCCRVFERGGRCLVEFSPKLPGEAGARAPADPRRQIGERLDALSEFLTRNRVRPRVITVCRSRHSGYTPAEHWREIEEGLLEALGRLYELRVRHVHELFPNNESEVTDDHHRRHV